MQILERYLTLQRRFGGARGAGGSSEATLDQVAETLYCTARNAKLVLRKLESEGLIGWRAGRGRGNFSSITFLADKEELLLNVLRRHADAGEYSEALRLLQLYGEGTAASEKFMDWMSDSFGFRQERGGEGDTLRLPIFKPIMTLDPAELVFSLSSHLIQQIFDRLLEYDESTGRILPGIAHHWERNEDATAWTFYLRKGVQFHDGTDLTAADAAFTAERLKNGGFKNGWIMRQSLLQAEVVSERIVRFRLRQPNWIFPQYACSNIMSILPTGLSGLGEEQFWQRPVGSGPFQVAEWTEGMLALKANPRYYRARAHLDRVEIVSVPQHEEIDARIGRLKWQQIIIDPSKRDVTADNGWIQIESKSLCTSLISWNMRREGPQLSAAFRRAVGLILDRHAMVRELGGYRHRPANSFIPESEESVGAAEAAPPDPEAIRKLLLEAGYDGSPLVLYTHAGHEEDAGWIQRRCAEFGVRTQVHIEGPESIHDVMNEAHWLLHALVLPEEEAGLIEGFEQEGSFLRELMGEELLAWATGRLDEALACGDRQERMRIYASIEARLREEAHVLFLLHMKFYTDYHPSLKGVRINSLGWIDFKDIWRE